MRKLEFLANSPWFWIGGISVVVLIVGLSVYANLGSIVKNVYIIVPWLGGLLGLCLWIRERFEPVYRTIAKVKAVISGTPVAIRMNVDYTLPYDGTDAISGIKQILIDKSTDSIILSSKIDELVIKSDGVDLSIRSGLSSNDEITQDNDFIEHINIQVLEYHAPYHLMNEVLSLKLLPILEDIEKLLKVNDSNYLFEAVFLKPNPFLGLYAKRIPFKNIHAFIVEFSDQAMSTNSLGSVVKITKGGVSIQAKRVSSLQNTVVKHLALSGG